MNQQKECGVREGREGERDSYLNSHGRPHWDDLWPKGDEETNANPWVCVGTCSTQGRTSRSRTPWAQVKKVERKSEIQHRSQVVQNIVNTWNNIGFYSEWDKKSAKYFEQSRVVTWGWSKAAGEVY